MLNLVLFFVLVGLHSLSADNSFHHNVDFTTDDNGERFKLHSSGVLSDVIDLDAVDGLKRLVCVDDRILLVTTQNDVGRDWRVGQLILGSTAWRCNASQGSGGDGIYAKISSIYFPTENRISIHIVQAGPYDMIEEANIHFRYSPGRPDLPLETKLRHRRYLSNILTKILGNLNWHANFSTRIPFNEHNNQTKAADKYFAVHKTFGSRQVDVSFSPSQEDLLMLKDDFTLRCIDCHGGTDMSYVFELLIKKVNNKPKLLKYISQLEGVSQLRADIEVEFSQEMGVNYTTPLWETGPIQLIRIPVAVVRRLPPVELSLAYNTQALASVFGYSRDSARGRTGFRASGRYTISQQFEASSSLHGDITSHAWTSDGQDMVEMNVPDTLNVTVDIFQKIFFNASVSWKVKDITINLYPPMEIIVKPSMKMESVINGLEVCTEATLAVDGLFSVEKSVLSVEAFGLNIWDVMLNPQISKRETLTESSLSITCLAHCDGPAELGPPLTQDQVCGAMSDRVSRTSSQFNGFEVLEGTDIVFAAEESELCELTPLSCSLCNSTDSTTICASRYVTARLARAITKLSQMVKIEWSNATLIVLAAWDEPSPAFPDGHHGNSSLHYEGRAAVVTVTGMPAANTTIDRLGSLCVCSGFDYVSINRDLAVAHVAMKRDGVTNTNTEKAMFEDLIADDVNDSRFQNCVREAPTLNVGDTVPSGEGVDEVCGPPQGVLSRVNYEDMERLYHYDRSDVVFRPEGNSTNVCGFSTRRCRTPCLPSRNQTEPWSYCSNRLMTPRMALKLKQLAKLAQTEAIGVNVERAFTEQPDVPLHYREGRGMQLTSSPISSLDRLAVLAACSGFDFMNFSSPQFIEVFVKSQEDFIGIRVEFSHEDIARLAVAPPPHQQIEYLYPESLENEAIIPNLFTGFDKETHLSEFYTIEDMSCPNRPYLRVDSSLLMCLDLISEEYDDKVEIIKGSGYRTQSVNMINFDIRHVEEMYRFQTGQAVELRPPGYRHDSELVHLAKMLFRSCTPFLRQQMRGLGVGCHKDRLYVDIRPLQVGNEMNYITLWNARNTTYFRQVLELQEELLDGGPVIHPFDKGICDMHPLGGAKQYLTFQFHQKGLCSTTEQPVFCSETLPFRKEEVRKLQERMTSAAGFGRLPRADINPDIQKCLVNLCGGCPATGHMWDEKVKACSVVVDKFINRATRAFPDLTDRATFFDTENAESSVHSLACHDGNICVENIQLYSLLMPLMTSRYRPEPSGSIEMLMFSSEKNPMPLMELVEQEMAYRAAGRVQIFIDHQEDVKSLKGILKVLMVYNKNVTEVEFHVYDDLDVDLIRADVQRNLDVWAGHTCSDHSRFAISPFTFHQLSRSRRKRSLARSQHRNEARQKIFDWEMEWMMKLL
ncbi:uncharacterized protein LOC124148471 [Haliotis rufescens]|uniref:uncharacterized protein LOC124148471 n=1 Tax=Haliotis rufescens TaxID=6454 RepID=UPI00201F2108|nr:uncharacterized protein LOC124148471 [Haliotis rufescens]